MPFGKYSGREIESCPKAYLEWIISKPQSEMLTFHINKVLDKWRSQRKGFTGLEDVFQLLDDNSLVVKSITINGRHVLGCYDANNNTIALDVKGEPIVLNVAVSPNCDFWESESQ